MRVPVDVLLRIKFDVKHPEHTTLETDMNREGVEEVLDCWLRGQMGRGKDERKPVERAVYTINIGVDLSDDTFYVNSDTGNASLTCGIIMDVFGKLDTLVSPA